MGRRATVALDITLVPTFEAVGAAAVMIVVRFLALAVLVARGRISSVATPRPAVGLVLAAVAGALAGDATAGYGIVVSVGAAASTFCVIALVTGRCGWPTYRDVRRGWSTRAVG